MALLLLKNSGRLALSISWTESQLNQAEWAGTLISSLLISLSSSSTSSFWGMTPGGY